MTKLLASLSLESLHSLGSHQVGSESDVTQGDVQEMIMTSEIFG